MLKPSLLKTSAMAKASFAGGESGKVNIDNLYHLVMIRVVSNKRFEPFINYTSR